MTHLSSNLCSAQMGYVTSVCFIPFTLIAVVYNWKVKPRHKFVVATYDIMSVQELAK